MKFKKFLYAKLYPTLGSGLIQILCRTISIETFGEDNVETLRQKREPIVFAFWHGRHLLLLYYMGHRDIDVVVSPSLDGTLIANVLKKSGFGVVRGSSNRKPIRALVEAISQMKKGRHIAFTVDGPKGPIYKVKPGAIYLAKKMNAYLIPVSTGFKKCWKLRSWDRYQIPKPFTKATIVFGTPYKLNSDLRESAIESACRELETKINNSTLKADNFN